MSGTAEGTISFAANHCNKFSGHAVDENLPTKSDEDEKKHEENGVHFQATPILENFEQEDLESKASTPISNKEELVAPSTKMDNGTNIEKVKVKRKYPKKNEDSDEEAAPTKTFTRNVKAKFELNVKKSENGGSFEKVGNSVFYVESCPSRGKTGTRKSARLLHFSCWLLCLRAGHIFSTMNNRVS